MSGSFTHLLATYYSLITLGIFLGLTLFTLQSKYDFSGMGPFLFGGLVALMMTGFVGMIFPFGKTFETIYAAGGALIFSGYIVYDTYEINKRMSPDEWIASSISLYLDFINLCELILHKYRIRC
jgi:FtsH-binding integral membrane protein